MYYVALGIALAIAVPALGQEAVQPQRLSQHETEAENASRDNGEQSAEENPDASSSLATDESAPQETKSGSETKPQYDPNQPLWDWRPYVVVTSSDTLAQWGMAIFGVIATVVSVIAVGLLWKTLRATRAAVDEAEQATLAANAAIELTRENAERELRAYVFLDTTVRHKVDPRSPWSVFLKIKNFGQTPAYNARLYVGVKIVDSTLPFGFELPKPDQVAVFTLAPRNTYGYTAEIPGFATAWEEFKAFKKRIYLWGRADFIDAFGNPRWITFRLFQDDRPVLDFEQDDCGNETSEDPKPS